MKHDTTTRITPAALAAAAAGDIANAAIAMQPGGIEAQEAAGQAMLVASEQLPRDLSGLTGEALEAIGFKFGAIIDELFVTATLPPGWIKTTGDNAYWSHIIDERGRERASIFYKAAFYDRRAHLRMAPRYTVNAYCDHPTDPALYRTEIHDAGKLLRVIGESPRVGGYKEQSALYDAGALWLEENFPNYRDALAYWDAP